jgi:hypothetical protein
MFGIPCQKSSIADGHKKVEKSRSNSLAEKSRVEDFNFVEKWTDRRLSSCNLVFGSSSAT